VGLDQIRRDYCDYDENADAARRHPLYKEVEAYIAAHDAGRRPDVVYLKAAKSRWPSARLSPRLISHPVHARARLALRRPPRACGLRHEKIPSSQCHFSLEDAAWEVRTCWTAIGEECATVL
jgi:hypothetical protein